jgi:dihydrofolate reductase
MTTPPITYSFIVTCDLEGGIGMACNITEDLRRFRDLTNNANKTNIIIMEKHTWEINGSKPMLGRYNIVVSKNISDYEMYVFEKGAYFVSSLDKALIFANEISTDEKPSNIFVIGDANLYEEALEDTRCITGYLTIVKEIFNYETFFPIDLMDHFETVYDGEWLCENNEEYDVDFRFINVIRTSSA